MKILTSLLIAGSLALAGAVMAQQTEETPGKKGGRGEKAEKTQGATETKPKSEKGAARGNKSETATSPTTATETGGPHGGGKHEHGAKPETKANATGAESTPTTGAGTNTATETGGKKGKHERNAPAGATGETGVAGASASPGTGAATETGGKKGRKGRTATENAAAGTGATASPGASAGMETGKKGAKGRAATAAASATAAPSASVGASAATSPVTSSSVGATGATGTTAMTKEQGTVGKNGKKVETQQVQQIKQQHASFKAQPKPNVAPAVTFNQNYRISGAESWQGPQYEVYRSYHPEMHDRNWYHSHYPRVELIAGGYYYWNNGYWYPAWGYDPGASYYAYDAPIYVGHRAEPPDKVIADVQAELQEMGYYTGEVDGLLGPLTRQALRDYQADHGLMVTEVIDEPTLEALQLS